MPSSLTPLGQPQPFDSGAVEADIAGFTVKPILVSHTIESAGFVISREGASLAGEDVAGFMRRLAIMAARLRIKRTRDGAQ